MAEARIEDEEESMRESRDPGARLNSRRANASSERVERNKPEQRHSSQGAFSSIRNVIKRTSTRSTSFRSPQIDHNRDRRRPEITILSAEPLANNAWYSGSSAAFPSGAPHAQPSWTNSILTVQLPPPSYEQVIREKTLEENISSSSSSSNSASSSNPTSNVPTPSAVSTPSTVQTPSPIPSTSSVFFPSSSSAPHPCTATIATQTDIETTCPVRTRTRHSVRRPPKPPPPALPLTPKSTNCAPTHTRSLIDLDSPESPRDICGLLHTRSSEIPSGPQSEECKVQTNFRDGDATGDLAHYSSAPILSDSSPDTHDPPLQCPMQQNVSARPRPHPRSKGGLQPIIQDDVLEQPMTREVKVQTLVRLKDDGTEHVFPGFTDSSTELASNAYLQELLDVFGYDDQCFQSNQGSESDQCQKSEEEDEAPESVPSSPSEALERPKPQPRIKNLKLPITPEPSSLTHGVLETESSSEEKSKQEECEEKNKRDPSEENSQENQSAPVPAPRPLLNRVSPSQQHSTSAESAAQTSRLSQPSGHPVAARRSKAPTQTEGAPPGQLSTAVPPKAPASTAPSPAPTTAAAVGPADRRKGPLGPRQTQMPFPAKRQPQRRPPPSSHMSTRATVSKSSASFRLLPLRPPPIKPAKSAGPSQNNAAANQLPGYRVPKRGPPLPPRPKPGHPLYRNYTSKVQANVNQNQTCSKTVREEPNFQKESFVVPPDDTHTPRQTRSSREVKSQSGDAHKGDEPVSQQREEQNARRQSKGEQPAEREAEPESKQESKGEQALHQARPNVGDSCVAQVAFEGEANELTLREGDVITLLECVNEEWGRGRLDGHTGLFPLSFVQSIAEVSSPRKTSSPPAPVYVGGRQTGRAMYDFTPECDDELCLKVGDIVCFLESVDEQWFEGEFRGRRGIVPKNYIQLLKDPEPLP